jgi:hypothetical protein
LVLARDFGLYFFFRGGLSYKDFGGIFRGWFGEISRLECSSFWPDYSQWEFLRFPLNRTNCQGSQFQRKVTLEHRNL